MTAAEPWSRTGLAERVGRLTTALELALQVIDERPDVLDPFHEILVRQARRTLTEHGCSAVTT